MLSDSKSSSDLIVISCHGYPELGPKFFSRIYSRPAQQSIDENHIHGNYYVLLGTKPMNYAQLDSIDLENCTPADSESIMYKCSTKYCTQKTWTLPYWQRVKLQHPTIHKWKTLIIRSYVSETIFLRWVLYRLDYIKHQINLLDYHFHYHVAFQRSTCFNSY